MLLFQLLKFLVNAVHVLLHVSIKPLHLGFKTQRFIVPTISNSELLLRAHLTLLPILGVLLRWLLGFLSVGERGRAHVELGRGGLLLSRVF